MRLSTADTKKMRRGVVRAWKEVKEIMSREGVPLDEARRLRKERAKAGQPVFTDRVVKEVEQPAEATPVCAQPPDWSRAFSLNGDYELLCAARDLVSSAGGFEQARQLVTALEALQTQ